MPDESPEESVPDQEPRGSDAELGDAVDEAMDPVRHEAIMQAWHNLAMTHVEEVRPPRDDDDLARRLYELRDEQDPPPS